MTTEASPKFTFRQRLSWPWFRASSGRCSRSSAAPGASRPSPKKAQRRFPSAREPAPRSSASGTSACCPAPSTSAARGATIIVSQSFDGELIARTLELFGYKTVRGSSSRGAREGLLGLKHVHRMRPPGHLHRRRSPRPDLPNQDGPHPARRSHRRAHRRFSSAAAPRLVIALLGSLFRAHAVYAHRSQLGALDRGPGRSRPRFA